MAAALEAESGLNDAPVILLVLALAEHLTGGATAAVVADRSSRSSASCSVARSSGWPSGLRRRRLLRRFALPLAGFYPLATLALCVLAFSSASLAHTSGFVAVYLCGLVLGNAPLPHRAASVGFAEGMASLAQIGLFVLLGLLASPDRLLGAIAPALAHRRCAAAGGPAAVGAASLVLVPHAVAAAGVHLVGGAARRRPHRAGDLPADRGASPGATFIFDTVFVLVVVFTLVQGESLPWVARRLGIATPADARGTSRSSPRRWTSSTPT